MKSVILNASFAFFIAVSSVAHADATQTTRQITVSYADLDLSRESGARVMLERLQSAASSVCGGVPDLHRLDNLTIYRACTRKALDDATTQLEAPAVSALYGRPVERLALGH